MADSSSDYSDTLLGGKMFVSPVIGLAQGALDLTLENLGARRSITGADLANQPTVQLRTAEADAAIAERVAREIVAEIHDAAVLDPVWEELGVTVSVGVSPITRAVSTSRTALVDADTAMYEAKEAGRNCCIVG